MMQRIDVRDWVTNHGCTIEVLNENNRGNAVKVINPKTGSHVFIDLPFDNKPVKHFTVCKICTTLGIEIPSESQYMSDLDKHITKIHHSTKPRNK